MTPATVTLSELYLEDETAWLDAMAERIQAGDFSDLDYVHLQEYLTDTAARDRRAVRSRLVVLITHILKWNYQPERRSRSWMSSIITQRQRLKSYAGTGVLRQHAVTILNEAYADAVERAVAETGLPAATFPAEFPYSLEQLLAFNPS